MVDDAQVNRACLFLVGGWVFWWGGADGGRPGKCHGDRAAESFWDLSLGTDVGNACEK